MKTFKKLAIPSLLLAGVAMSPLALAHSPFDGKDLTVNFEAWETDDDNNITKVELIRNTEEVTASDSESPDIEDFHAMDADFHLWDIDFVKDKITMTFTSIYEQDNDNQYMYMRAVGFHFADTADNLPDILHVEVGDQFAPSAYNKDLVKYDADNIYVNLEGSMCHIAGMASMPECTNDDSPTGYSNVIMLNILDADIIDHLYDWAEDKYSDIFPSHEESFYLLGYYVREYPDFYIGTFEGRIYSYIKETGELNDLGEADMYIDLMHEDMMSNSGDCPEGQHMMPDGTCMNNM